ncbi:hypothetical protein [Streptomyces mirabilis]|uniref:hypothetical protein n=1 Tax=Streptomyces mirabilis TaxID=68239 RepID=UPI00332568D4
MAGPVGAQVCLAQVDDAADDPVGDVLGGWLLAVQQHPDGVARDTAFVRELFHVEHVVAALSVPDQGADTAEGLGERPARFSHRPVS